MGMAPPCVCVFPPLFVMLLLFSNDKLRWGPGKKNSKGWDELD